MKDSKFLAIVVIILIVVQAFAATTIIQAKADAISPVTLESAPIKNYLNIFDAIENLYFLGGLLGLNKPALLTPLNHVVHDPNYGVDFIVINPKRATTVAGQSQTFTAMAYNNGGHGHDISTLPGTTWSINSGAGTYVWTGNSVQVTKAGTWKVTVTYKGHSDTASLTVTHTDDGKLDHIAAALNPTSVEVPNTVIGNATAFDVYGNSWDISTLATWSVPAGGDGGHWTANKYQSHTAGTFTIQAEYQGKTATTSLTVTHATDIAYLDYITISPKQSTVNAGINQTYTATAHDSFGNNWVVNANYSCTDTSVVISNNSAYSNTAGVYTITGIFNGKTDTATLTVTGHLQSIKSVAIIPKTAEVKAGLSKTFSATATDGYNTWDITNQVTWSIVESGDGGSWNQATGTYTSAVASTWTVKATLGALSDTATLTVNANAALLDHIVISPKTASVLAGTSQKYTVTAYDKLGNSLGDVTSSTVFAAAGASISANSVSSNNVGSYSVTATYSGLIDTASLTVTGYTVTYTERGLPAGTSWSITFANVIYSSTTDTISITGLSAISYSWSTSDFIENSQSRYAAAQTSGTLSVPGKTTQNIDYSTQYLVIYTATGNVLSVAVPPNEWINSDGTATGAFSVQVTNAADDTKCNLIGDNRTQTITAPTTITATYQTQYFLSVNSPHNTASGKGWYNAGDLATASLNSGTSSTSSGTQQVFTGWKDDASGLDLISHSILMNSPKTATANWNTEYLVTYAVTGNILPINAPGKEWVISGAAAQGKFAQTIANLSNDTQCLFQGDNRPATITKPTTITATYETQYKVTFSQTGIQVDAKGPIVEILGEPQGYSQLARSIWAIPGAEVDFQFNSTVASATADKAYTLLGVNATSPLMVNEPTLIQGNYQAEFSASLYSVLEILLIIFAVSMTTILMLRYRSNMKKQRDLTVAANPDR